MTFQLTDFPRLLPELMLMLLALLVLGSDVLERWGADPASQLERSRAASQLATTGLGLVFLVALVQSRYLFAIGEPSGNELLDRLGGLLRNLQDAGPGRTPILGAFATDHLTMIARLTFIGAAFLASLLTFDFNPSGSPGEFYALLLLSTAGMCLMAGATELILAYLSLELSSIALYVLAGYFRSDARSSEAGMKYFLFGAISSAILLYGMSLAYGFTASAALGAGEGRAVIGTLFSSIAEASARVGDTSLLTLALILIIAGIGYKIAVVPFHSWSPDVYQGAPTPITAFISTASKTAGFVLLYRLLTTAFPALAGQPGLEGGWTSMLALIALLTMVVGNLSALPQTNAKRLLAYSSIGHAGFVLLALLLWSASSAADQAFSTSALLYYLIVYTLTNLGAFGALAVVGNALGGDEIADLNGLAKRNTGLATILTVLVLSLAGVPPLAGYWAKFFVFMTGYKAGAVWLVGVAVVMTIVSLFFYLRLLRAIWIAEPADAAPIATPRPMQVSLVVSTALVVLLGVFPNLIWGLLGQASVVAGR